MKRSILFLLWVLTAFRAAAQQPAPLRESFDLIVPQTPMRVPVEGDHQISYELHLTNFSGQPLTIRAIRIADPRDGRIVASFAGDALDRRLALVSGGRGPIPPGQRAILYVEIDGPAPGDLIHRIDYLGHDSDTVLHMAGARLTVPATRPVTLGPPLAGGPWAAVHDPSWPRGHRRVSYTIDGRVRIPGRYAIDFVRLDDAGRITTGDPDSARDALGYGATVLAVADGTIVGLRDDVPESALISRNPDHPLGEGAGNYIALRLTGGQIAFYEHLRPGSLLVRAGDKVRRGQPIGALGFTGDTTGPHLHFHLADGNSLLGAEGIPFTFDRFALLGGFHDIAQLGKEPWQPSTLAPDRRQEWPGFNRVVAFASAPSARAQ